MHLLLLIALVTPAHHRQNFKRHPRRGPSKPALWTAYCRDGTHTFAKSHRGACSHHGGVRQWITQPEK